MKTGTRLTRINDEIMRESAKIIQLEVKDPRLSPLTSVTKVDTTNDLKICKIYVSVLGGEENKKDTLVALKNASGFIRKELAKRINLRITPELTFLIDDTAEYAARLEALIDKATKGLSDSDTEN